MFGLFLVEEGTASKVWFWSGPVISIQMGFWIHNMFGTSQPAESKPKMVVLGFAREELKGERRLQISLSVSPVIFKFPVVTHSKIMK